MSKPWFIFPVSLAIREFLSEKGKASPSDFYQSYKIFKNTTSYESISRTFYNLKRLGLIEIVGKEKSRAPIDKTLYSLINEKIKSPEWRSPQRALYPKHFGGKFND